MFLGTQKFLAAGGEHQPSPSCEHTVRKRAFIQDSLICDKTTLECGTEHARLSVSALRRGAGSSPGRHYRAGCWQTLNDRSFTEGVHCRGRHLTLNGKCKNGEMGRGGGAAAARKRFTSSGPRKPNCSKVAKCSNGNVRKKCSEFRNCLGYFSQSILIQ